MIATAAFTLAVIMPGSHEPEDTIRVLSPGGQECPFLADVPGDLAMPADAQGCPQFLGAKTVRR